MTIPRESEPMWVPPGDAAGEEPRDMPELVTDTSAPELRVPAPEEGASPDGGAIHWHEQSETGLADTRAQADAEARDLREGVDVAE
jgi:hypothetical protein